ncbi:hypothetical protein J3R83DRAFT_1341 [Lanmaoa asiatica]|nr:hypothetical protein J3R83DRAFT_1341 [Lanmaoa asiatica]
MLAVISGADESSAGYLPQSVIEKLDDLRATPGGVAEDSRTNGNGNARKESEADESEADADTEDDGESEDGEDDAKGTLDVNVGYGYDDNGGEDEEEENEDDDDDDEEEEEPSLKYERIGGAINDLLKKDSASALVVSNKCLAGERIKSFKPHQASVSDIEMDNTADFVATASIDGQVVVHSLSTTESYVFDMKRPIRTVALEPHFAKRTSRAFVCGGMAGTLVLREKGWLGHKETVLHSGEGPIWHVRWREHFIAWANDLVSFLVLLPCHHFTNVYYILQGVKIYDTQSQSRITFIDRPPDSPRADLFKCTLYWQDDSTLLIAWADHIKVARIRSRPSGGAKLSPWIVEVTAAFQLDCMISGILPHPMSSQRLPPENGNTTFAVTLTSFLILAYEPPDTYGDEMTSDHARQARKTAERPELRIISRSGEELTADALGVTNYQAWGCNDYLLAEVNPVSADGDQCYVVVSPKDIVLVRPRDRKDHIAWLVEHKRYEEALDEVEKLGEDERASETPDSRIDPVQIGARYIKHLIGEGDFTKAARLCPKVCGQNVRKWEEWIFVFAQRYQLQTIIPYVPTAAPQLGHLVYEMILGHFLTHDKLALLRMIREWPSSIYDISAVIVAIQSGIRQDSIFILRVAELGGRPVDGVPCRFVRTYTVNRQYGKALPFFLRLRRPNVFDLIREHNLFTDVQDQALLLVEFDQELNEKRRQEGHESALSRSEAITLLVDHTHSIPVGRVVQQLRPRPLYLFHYLDALFKKDQLLASDFADLQVTLFAEYATSRLIEYLRASSYYHLEGAYDICRSRDLVPEMVFLLGRMGNNKKALTLIIERIGDAIEFAKEQNDDDLWEDLLKYAETRPTFIRGLLENVGAEIDPIRLIRRIKNGLEIPGLKEALIKILHDFQLQISLLEGCQAILNGDSANLASIRQRGQNSGFFFGAKAPCLLCDEPLQRSPQDLLLLFLCRHVVHANCIDGVDDLPRYIESSLDVSTRTRPAHEVSAKIAL